MTHKICKPNCMIVQCILTALFFMAPAAAGQQKFLNDADRIPDHPRILFFNGEEDDVKKNIEESRVMYAIHSEILNACEGMLSAAPVTYKKSGKRLLEVSRRALKRIFYLSYAYRMTEDPRYLKRAEKELLAVSGFKDWNPAHFLDAAEMTMAVAIGYDWLYNGLSPESRDVIRDAIILKGLSPSFNYRFNGFLRASHNWNQVCNSGMSYGALAVIEDAPDLSKYLIERSISSLELALGEYAPDGAYPEGPMYWSYGTGFCVMMMSALEKIFGRDFNLTKFPGFMSTGYYYRETVAPSGMLFNYSDCETTKNLNETMFWFAGKTGDMSLLYDEEKIMDSPDFRKRLCERLLPAALIWGRDCGFGKIAPPSHKILVADGKAPIAFMRTSWSSPEAIFVGFKGGQANTSHGHMDAGSFVMESDGVRWALDLGKQDYNSLETKGRDIWDRTQDSFRWKILRYSNFAHNTLTVNDSQHKVDGRATIISHSSDDGFLNVVADLCPLFENHLASAKRGVAIVENRYVLVQDETETLPGEPAKVRWTMVTDADVEQKKHDSVLLKKDGKKLLIQFKSDVPLKVMTWSANPGNGYDAPNPGVTLLGFEAEVPAGVKATFKTLLYPGARKETPIDRELKYWINE